MTPYWWTCTLLLTVHTLASSAETVLANDLQELSRSVRWKHLPLQDRPPDDVTVDIPHDDSIVRFAEWVYGTPDSPRIAIAVAITSDADVVIYADKNRDRVLGARDLVRGTGAFRKLSLPALQVVGDVMEAHPRQVLFRWAGKNASLSVATATRIEHAIHPDGDLTRPALQTRQIDGTANGLFADPQDLIQIDLNHDGRFDPFLETYPFRPLMKIGGQRWFAKADRFGKRLQLESATTTGRVRIATHARSKLDDITDMIVTLAGEDGSVYSLSGTQALTDLPVGRYAASVLFVAIKPEGSDRAWEFTFSRNGGIRAKDWLQVSEGSTVMFDPIGDFVMDATVDGSRFTETQDIIVQPRLFTGSGLLINLCRVDGKNSRNGPRCHVSLMDPNDRSISQSTSGFA